MKHKAPLMIVCLVLLLGSASALTIDFYYSDTCPYCQQIKPFIYEQEQKYLDYTFNYYETSEYYKDYNAERFEGVPAFKITTDDGRIIKVVGADILKLTCEFQQMSTKDCLTISADNSIGGSWFK